MKIPRNIVGPVVRKLRQENELTQNQFVTKLNLRGWDVSRDIIARIEGQVRWVADFEIARLAEGLEVEPAELLRQALAKFKGRTLP